VRSLTAAVAAALVLLPAAPAWAAGSPPVAVDDAVTYRNNGGQDYPVDALANDSDPDGDPLTYTAVTPAAKGNAYLHDGELYYKPFLGQTGTDAFTYTVTDGQGNSATGTVTATLWVDPGAPGDAAITIPGPGSATLSWTAADRAAEYRIYDADGALVHSTPDLTWTVTGLVDSQYYYWSVYAVNGGGWTGGASYSLSRSPMLPTPQALHVGGTGDGTALRLTWDGGHMAGPWRVYRDGTPVGTSLWASYDDTGLLPGREYSYEVQLIGSSTQTVAWLPSPLSAAVRGTPGVLSPIGQLFQDLGSSAGILGPVTYAERRIAHGRVQDHLNGQILQPDGGTPFAVTGSLHAGFLASGGVTGQLGFPLGGQESGLRDGGFGQVFEGGSIWGSSSTLPRVVWPVIEDGWAESGWEDGPLGYPVSTQVERHGGVQQDFEDGGVYWSPATGSHGVSGPLHEHYLASGRAGGPLGFPASGETCGLRGDGCYQVFQGGAVYWSPASGAQVVSGGFRHMWSTRGAENGGLGYPTSGETCGLRGGGCYQSFQGGSLYWSPASGAHVISGGFRHMWSTRGAENGGLGYPTSGETCGLRGGGCYQLFEGGSIYWSPASGAHVVLGGIRDAWARQGWEAGRLGYPVGNESFSGGAYRQTFQGGTITISSTGTRIAYR
jgi:uncharacterized protein with LGFP repeats